MCSSALIAAFVEDKRLYGRAAYYYPNPLLIVLATGIRTLYLL